MCAECNARSFCLWCYSGKAAGDVYSTEWRAAICMLVCLLMVCSWKDGRNQEVLLSSRACCLFFLLSSSSCAISASVKNILGKNKAPPSSSRTPAVRHASQRKEGRRRRQRVFCKGWGVVGSKLWLQQRSKKRDGSTHAEPTDEVKQKQLRSTVSRCRLVG